MNNKISEMIENKKNEYQSKQDELASIEEQFRAESVKVEEQKAYLGKDRREELECLDQIKEIVSKLDKAKEDFSVIDFDKIVDKVNKEYDNDILDWDNSLEEKYNGLIAGIDSVKEHPDFNDVNVQVNPISVDEVSPVVSAPVEQTPEVDEQQIVDIESQLSDFKNNFEAPVVEDPVAVVDTTQNVVETPVDVQTEDVTQVFGESADNVEEPKEVTEEAAIMPAEEISEQPSFTDTVNLQTGDATGDLLSNQAEVNDQLKEMTENMTTGSDLNGSSEVSSNFDDAPKATDDVYMSQIETSEPIQVVGVEPYEKKEEVVQDNVPTANELHVPTEEDLVQDNVPTTNELHVPTEEDLAQDNVPTSNELHTPTEADLGQTTEVVNAAPGTDVFVGSLPAEFAQVDNSQPVETQENAQDFVAPEYQTDFSQMVENAPEAVEQTQVSNVEVSSSNPEINPDQVFGVPTDLSQDRGLVRGLPR